VTPARVFELPAEPADLEDRAAYAAELRQRKTALNAEADRLDGGDLLTTAEAASLCGRSAENMRQWCRAFGIGEFVPRAHGYLISRAKLRAHLLAKHGRLPHALKTEPILSAPKNKTA
jgi:hypothetical protein